jgi:hypothetical protein
MQGRVGLYLCYRKADRVQCAQCICESGEQVLVHVGDPVSCSCVLSLVGRHRHQVEMLLSRCNDVEGPGHIVLQRCEV